MFVGRVMGKKLFSTSYLTSIIPALKKHLSIPDKLDQRTKDYDLMSDLLSMHPDLQDCIDNPITMSDLDLFWPKPRPKPKPELEPEPVHHPDVEVTFLAPHDSGDGYVYVAALSEKHVFKLGKRSKDLESYENSLKARFRDLKLEIVFAVSSPTFHQLERDVLAHFYRNNMLTRGAHILLYGRECFYFPAEEMQNQLRTYLSAEGIVYIDKMNRRSPH